MAKKLTLTVVCWLIVINFIAANPVLKTLNWSGFKREYLVYTPQRQQPEKPEGIVVCLHGFTRKMDDFFVEYNFRPIADSLNFIIVAPQALPEQNLWLNIETAIANSLLGNVINLNSVWGCGLALKINSIVIPSWEIINEELNRDIDDTDFIDQVIDATLADYALPPKNLFMLGSSMGGYMTYQYALKKGDRLSGIIPICGSMGLNIKNMDYTKKVAVCDFHSITDEVVPYDGSRVQLETLSRVSLAKSKSDVLKYWTETNQAGGIPTTEKIQKYPSTNGITVEKITYPESEYEVIHYKIDGANHSYFFEKGNGDCMDYQEEVIQFIQAHKSGKLTGTPEISAGKSGFYPNPVQDIIHFETMCGTLAVYDITGRKVLSKSFQTGQADLSFLRPGIYIVRIQSENGTYTDKVIKL